MRSVIMLGCLFLGTVSVAQANSMNEQFTEPDASLALQISKRVAAMENAKDLPSRAVWLSNRVVASSRSIALQSTQPLAKPQKKKNISLKN